MSEGRESGDEERSGRAGDQRPPRYLDDHVAEQAGRADLRARDELFIHLGHWDTLSPGAADEDLRAAQRRLDEHLVRLADVRDGLAILDVGCGFGGTIGTIDAAARDLSLVGLNVDRRQLEIAAANVRARPGSSVAWTLGDACAMPFEARSFDRALAIECAFHFASRRRFFAEAARVLREGGLLAMSDLVPGPALPGSRALLPEGLEAALTEALAPCPWLLGGEGTHDEMAASAGLSLVRREDASLATLPSYACILRGKVVDFGAADHPVGDRGVAALAWLQLRGLLRVEYFLFRKA